MTTRPVIGRAEVLGNLPASERGGAKGFFAVTRGSGALAVEGSMTTLKSLMMVGALLVGGASLAVAQNGPATGSQAPVAGGAAGNPAASGTAASIPAQTA